MAGDSQSGISIMKMEEGLDTGPVCNQATLPIHATLTAGELHDELASLGAALMVETLESQAGGTIRLYQNTLVAGRNLFTFRYKEPAAR